MKRPRYGRIATLMAAYAWLALFFLVPMAIVAKISLSRSEIAQPPYSPVFAWSDGLSGWIAKTQMLGWDAYDGLIADSLYLDSYLSSLRLAAIATAITLLIAYPFAYAITRAAPRWRNALLLLAVAPFWTSFLVRVYAWTLILKDEGLLNRALLGAHVISEPLAIFATEKAVIIGIVYSYLPFMILPIASALIHQDGALAEAAADLGAGPIRTFWRITVPLSLPGILAGVLLVFIPATGEFVIPDLLGGSDTLMIGHTMWVDFFENRDWPSASAAAIVLLVVLAMPLVFFQRAQARAGRAAQ